MKFVCLLLALLLMTACVAPRPAAVHGFSAESAQALALSPYFLGRPGPDIDLATTLTRESAAHQPFTGLLQPTLLLVGTVSDTLSSSSPAAPVAGCQGDYLPQLRLAADGSLAGSLTFHDYRPSCGLGLAGQLSFRGDGDPGSGKRHVELDLSGLELLVGEQRLSLAGEIELHSESGQPLSAEVNLDLVGPDRLSYRLRDLRLSWDRDRQYQRVALDGTIVHGSFGACRVETESPLLLSSENGLPYDGMLRFHAGDGSWARLFFPNTGYPGAFRLDASSGMRTMGKL